MRSHHHAACAAVLLSVFMSGCSQKQPRPGTIADEAQKAGVKAEQLKAANEDYFHDMDFNVVDGKPVRPFTPTEIEGRNMWIVWTGGNDRLWDG